MSLLKALGKVAGGLVSRATGGLINPRINFQPPTRQQPDSIVTRQGGLAGLIGGNRTTSYYTQPGQNKSLNDGPGTSMVPGAGCGVQWTGTRWRAQRLNKSTYVTRGGGTSRWPRQLVVHEKGTECVTVRRRNVANGKALRRAISRLKGFVKVYRKAASALGVNRHRRSACSSCGHNPCKCKR